MKIYVYKFDSNFRETLRNEPIMEYDSPKSLAKFYNISLPRLINLLDSSEVYEGVIFTSRKSKLKPSSFVEIYVYDVKTRKERLFHDYASIKFKTDVPLRRIKDNIDNGKIVDGRYIFSRNPHNPEDDDIPKSVEEPIPEKEVKGDDIDSVLKEIEENNKKPYQFSRKT